ncbi:immunoglobulin superfamily DCC subclass member 3-like [Vicugna pacos]|uniref:immunoglobulin superfamily DCC subclass member 3-like n=1 Tax=Vicugna pacos TaxID=30538 RepID=UPI003BB91138
MAGRGSKLRGRHRPQEASMSRPHLLSPQAVLQALSWPSCRSQGTWWLCRSARWCCCLARWRASHPCPLPGSGMGWFWPTTVVPPLCRMAPCIWPPCPPTGASPPAPVSTTAWPNRYGRLVSQRAQCSWQVCHASTNIQSPWRWSGGVTHFQCLIRGVPEPSISWEHNSTTLSTADHRATLLPSGILHITNVSQADVGTYCCVARNVANTCHSQDARLTLKDGRSIGVEGIQVLGTGNLMISDVSVQPSRVYVCAANWPGIRVRRTAQGVLLVQALPEFVQWPQSLSKPPGSSAVFTCVAQGVPETPLGWLKNGKGLSPGNNIRVTHNNRYPRVQGWMLLQPGREQLTAWGCGGHPRGPGCPHNLPPLPPSGLETQPLLQTGVSGVLGSASYCHGQSCAPQTPGSKWKKARGED